MHKLYSKDLIVYLKAFDVIGLVETWCNTSEAPMIEGYNILGGCNAVKNKAKKGRKSGGLVVYVKEEFKNMKFNACTDGFNCVSVVSRQEVLVFTYRIPEGSPYCDPKYFDKLEDFLSELEEKGAQKVVLMGDLNSRTGTERDFIVWDKREDLESYEIKSRNNKDEVVSVSGKALLDVCKLRGLRIMNGRTQADPAGDYTYMGAQGQSTIDYVLVSEEYFNEIEDVRVGNRIESNHMPLEITLKERRKEQTLRDEVETEEVIKISKYKWKESEANNVSIQIEKQKDWLAEKIAQATETSDYTGILHHWMKRVFRSMKMNTKSETKKDIVDEIEDIRKEVKAALSKLKEKGTRQNLEAYTSIRKKWKTAVIQDAKMKRQERQEVVKALHEKRDWGMLWKKVNAATGRKKFCAPSEKIKTKHWIDYFDKLYNVVTNGDKDHWADLSACEDTVDELDREISPGEIIKHLRSMKGNTSPGVDGFPTEFYKKHSQILVPLLAKIFNSVLDSEKFPAEWSQSVVLPIFKNKGSKDDCSNYRGISLLPCIGKILTKILDARFMKWSHENKLLPNSQAGFRKHFSTVDQIFILNTIIEGRLRRGRTTYVAFIDFSKAFDCVDRAALWYKLSKMGISKKMLNLLMSMYKASKFSVKVDKNSISLPVESKTGVLQGAQNSPALFIHFIADLADVLQGEDCDPPNLWNMAMPALFFADDVALISTSVLGLQRLLNKLEDYCNTWRLNVNLSKTKVMVFKKGAKLKKVEKWFYRSQKVEVVNNYTYLGVKFTYNGKWNAHIKDKSTKCKYSGMQLGRFARRHGDCSTKLFQHLFDTLVKSAMSYGSEIFAMTPRMDLLVNIERQFYRKTYGLANGVSGVALEVALGVANVEVNSRIKALNYWHKLATGEGNELVKLAYLQQREWAEQNLRCWGLDIKNELSRNGFAYVWEKPEGMTRKVFKNAIGQRLRDVSFQENIGRLKEYPSARYLSSIDPNVINPCQRVNGVKSEYRRRMFLKVLLEAHEDLISRETCYITCRDCGELMETSVLKHRLLACMATKGLREKLEVSLPDIIEWKTLITFVLVKLEKKGGFKWAQLLESVIDE